MTARLSAQLYSLGREPYDDIHGTIARLAALGYVAIEPVIRVSDDAEQMRAIVSRGQGAGAPRPTLDVVELKRALDAHGMVAPSSHVPLPEGDAAEEILDEQELVGGTLLITALLFDAEAGTLEQFKDLDRIKQLADRFNRAAELARPRGMRVGYHNHSWEFGADFDGRSGLEVFFDLCEPDVVSEVDVHWAHLGGRDPAELVRSLGERVVLLHVKEHGGQLGGPTTVAGDAALRLPAALGVPPVLDVPPVFDLPAVLDAARSAEWHVVEFEQMDSARIWPALDASARYLVEHGYSIGRSA